MDTTLTTKGFTIVEALVGITILLLSITAVLSSTSSSISHSATAREQITAFYLAQEAIEIVRNTRDNNSINGNAWLDGLSSCLGTCTLDALNLADPARACPPGGCPHLKLNSSGAYQYSSGDDTIFRREVEIREGIPSQDAIIDVSVFWQRGSLERSFTIQSIILNWQ